MGIYSDWAPKYFESGIYTVPCKDKKPIIGYGWQKYCENPPDESHLSKWIETHSDANQLGLLLGPSTGKVAFDFDYAYNPKKCTISKEDFAKDRIRIEKEIMELLPITYFGKVGAKGWTRFYAWNKLLVNRSTTRNGVGLFDFLSQGKQTIIPPSVHSILEDKKIIYKWIDESLEYGAGKLPELSMEIIETIISLYSDRPRGRRPQLQDMSRHERVMYFIIDALRVDQSLERIALKAIDYDKIVNDTPYLIDPKYYNDTDAYKNSLEFVMKINKWATRKEALKTKEEKREPKAFTDNCWNHFFETSFFEVRKDIFSEDTFIRKKAKAKWELIKSKDGVLRAYTKNFGLPKSQVVDELDRWAFEKSDLKFLCDVPAWDGTDRVASIAGSITSDKFTQTQIIDIFKHWGVGIFRRLENPETQNRCIILKGDQGHGKDTLVRSMLKEFKPYYKASTLPGTQKDVLEIVSSLLIVHIEEFDQTKGIDIGFLKSLITQPSSFFREAYGYAPNEKLMRPSFISSANVDDILRDPSGNRRFIVIPVSKIAWDYPQDESLQVVAQWKSMFERGECFTLPKETEDAIKVVIDAYTPESLEVSIMELYRARMMGLTVGLNARYPNALCLNGGQVTEMLCGLAKTFNCSLRRVQSAVKSSGLTRRSKNGILYYTDPTPAAMWQKDDDASV